jgi:DNA-binding transcriptional LysR family regulator
MLLAAVPQHRRQAQRRHKLRVSAPPTFARQVLVPELADFGASHPGVELEVVLSIPFLDLRPGEADVEVLLGAPGTPGFEVLMHDRVWPLAAPALLQRLGHPRTAAALAALPLLRTPLEPWTPWFRAAGLDRPEPAEGPMLVDLGLTLEAAVAGQGLALARPTLARAWLAGGALVAPLPLPAEPAQQYGLRHGDGEAAATFARWLAGRCAARSAEAAALLGQA